MDIKTLNLVLVVATSSTALVLIVMHRLRFSVQGTLFWACGSLTVACSLFLLALRDLLPDVVTIVVANTAAMYGFGLIWGGVRSFLDRNSLLRVTLTVPAILAPFLFWFSEVQPSLSIRVVLFSTMGGAISGVIAYELLKRDETKDRPAQRFLGAVFTGVALLLLVRAFLTLFQPSAPHFFASGYITVLAYVLVLVFLIGGTAGVIMMVSEKLQAEVKTLKGIMPICANCKKVRDDQGYWKQIESYIRDHSEADFTHGICPDCRRVLYPDMIEDEDEFTKELAES